MTLPDAGWYQDPEDSALLRWWTGADWSTQRRSAVTQPTPSAPYASSSARAAADARAAYVPMAGFGPATADEVKPTRREKERQVRRNNSMAYTGLLLALISLLINPLAILGILGIVFSAIGIAKSGDLEAAGLRLTGRGMAFAGLIIGSLVTVFFFWNFSTLMS